MVIDSHLRDRILSAVPAICLVSGSSTYFGIARSTAVAAWLTEEGVVILGIEGFRCDGKAIEPQIDFVADFSPLTGSHAQRLKESGSAAQNVLQRWSDKVEFVEFALEDS